MSNRLQDRKHSLRTELRHGRPLSVSEQRLMGGLASAESRILGSAQLGCLGERAGCDSGGQVHRERRADRLPAVQ